ncbi:MAG: hypothetical protein KGL35_24835 [Bradyrhizobium sp.]|nr:hypothetical protein [Bradyrhizobium sp.]
MSDVIAMAITCPDCSTRVHNDDPDIKHPLEFLAALRARGWFIPDTQYPSPPPSKSRAHACPACARKGA